MARLYPKITVSEKAEDLLKKGHVWVWASEVLSADQPYEGGAIVDILSKKGKYLGSGFINDRSTIRIRLFSRNTNDRFDEAFWTRRVSYAADYRRTVMPGDDFSCTRLIFSEADAFPGVVIDRFGEILVSEITCLGMEKIKDILYRALLEKLASMGEKITALYERNDSSIRAIEGLDQYCAFYASPLLPEKTPEPETQITENGIRYRVDFANGQKTGFFLDQKYNRAAVARVAAGKKVLDCFTHTGAFALNAAMGGASHVTAVDISASALANAKFNAALNGLSEKVDFVCADVFEYLNDPARESERYGLIILDPPAFTKSRDTIHNAMQGYRQINRRAMKLLGRGGYLATCSCSHFMSDTLFCQMIHNAAEDAGVGLRQIEGRQQAPDHPILWNVPETDYLKFYIFQIV